MTSHIIYPPGGSPSDRLSALLSDPIAVSTTATATISRMHYVTGTIGDYTITLPTAVGNKNKHIGFIFGPSTTELSRFVTVDGNSTELINGLQNRVFWAGEALEIESDNANWLVVDYKPMMMAATMSKTSQNIASTATDKIALDSIGLDNTGQMATTTGNKIVCRRSGLYTILSYGNWAPLKAGNLWSVFPKINAVAQLSSFQTLTTDGGGNFFFTTQVTQPNILVSSGNDMELFAQSFSSTTETISNSTFAVVEQLGW